jgi:biotin carboxyl carrier protein
MKQNIQVTVNGKSYEVEIEDLDASPLCVRVNGQEYQVAVDEAPAASPASLAPAAAPVRPAAVLATPPAPGVSGAASDTLTAPMPGVILSVAVKPGETVSYGQLLCTLEAMKMKNAIRAPREGTIAHVEVQEGQRVNYGDVLITFTA